MKSSKSKVAIALVAFLGFFLGMALLASNVAADQYLVEDGDSWAYSGSSSGVSATIGIVVTSVPENDSEAIIGNEYESGVLVSSDVSLYPYVISDDDLLGYDLSGTNGTATYAGRSCDYLNYSSLGVYYVYDWDTGILLEMYSPGVGGTPAVEITLSAWSYTPSGPSLPGIPGYDLFIIVGAIGVISCVLILAYKRRK